MRVDTDSNYSSKLRIMILSKKNQDDRAICWSNQEEQREFNKKKGMPTWSWRVRAKTMSASTWLRLVKGVLFASTVLASVAGTSSFCLVLNPPSPPSILPVLSALSTLWESSGCSFLLASTSAGEVGAAGDAPLLSISTSLCFRLMWPDFSSRENKATVIAIASWSNSNLPVCPFNKAQFVTSSLPVD